jgi:hypothetical protein
MKSIAAGKRSVWQNSGRYSRRRLSCRAKLDCLCPQKQACSAHRDVIYRYFDEFVVPKAPSQEKHP